MPQVRVTPSGIMDKDTDVSYVNQGNYTDANNIRHRQTDGGNFAGIMPIKGNALKNTIPGYTTGQKRYRFYVDISDLVSGELASHDANLTISFVYSGTGAIPVTYTESVNYAGTDISGTVSTIQSQILTLVAPEDSIPTFSVAPPGGYTGNTAYFDMYWSNQDFTVVVDSTQGTYASVYLLDEYLTDSGNFVVVGSEQIDNDLFLFLAGDDLVDGIRSVVSEIGVLYSTDNDSTFSYVRLLRSKKLGFSPTRKIEVQSEKTTDQISFYLTDDLTKPKAIYLKYANKRTADGLLFSEGGRYELDNIDIETALFFPAPSSYFDEIEVLEGAGSLTAGNKRYTGRFLSEDFVPTDFFYPTNPINIYNAEFNKPYLVTGNTSNVITNKSVRLKLKNIPINVYKYFELVAIEYAGESFTAKIVQRFPIFADKTEIILEHTDRGQENIQLGPNELVAITQKYISAKTLKIFDNRMTMSNLVEQVDLNLSAWAQTIKHEIKRKQISFIGKLDSLLDENINYTLNEYINPENVLKNTSYMFNDTYRFGVQVQWKETGKWSSPYWVDDIRIDTASSNIIGNRRVAPSFTNASLTESIADGNDVYVYYVRFSEINLDYPVNGVALKSLIKSIRFTRAERIPEVLATGMFCMGTRFFRPSFTWEDILGNNHTESDYSDPNIVPFFPSDTIWHSAGFPYSYANLNADTGTDDRDDWNLTTQDNSRYLFFYSPDYYFNERGSDYQFDTNKDTLKILGVPGTVNRIYGTYGNAEFESQYLEFDGNIGTPTNNTYKQFVPTHHVYLPSGGNAMLDGEKVFAGAPYNINYPFNQTDKRTTYDHYPPERNKYTRSTQVFKLDSKLSLDSEWSATGRNSSSLGMFYGQIFRDLGGHKKYPINKELTVYQSTGHLRNLQTGESGKISEDVFGGDVFNQKTFMLLRMGEKTTNNVTGLGVVLGMYSQNVLNTQMFNYTEWDNTETGSGYAFPQYLDRSTGKTLKEALWSYAQQWLAVSNNNNYEKCYDFKDGTITEQGFDANKSIVSDLPSRITWSAKKIINSKIDNYRIFKPLDFIDLDLTSGEISHHEIVNNNFYTFQERSVQRQYFRDPSAISSENGNEIVVGSGSIMVSRGQEITNIGTSKKSSVIKGKTANGKEAVYWFNDRLQKLMRFGEDGSRVLSDKGLLSYLVNNAKFLSSEFYPLSGKGVHGVWNDRYSELIMTFKYNDGVSNKSFTLVYDELKNGFICFHTYFPNIYLPYNNTFFSSNPSNQNQLYLHDSGSESTFYGVTQDANIEMVMNYEPNTSKNFEALQIASEQKPFGANFTTKNHVSFLVQNDFDLREDLYYSTIKNDSTGTGVNSNNTSRLWGRWIKIKVNLKSTSVGQKLINAIVKFRMMPRLYNQ